MATNTKLFATRLLARLFAFPWAMTLLLAFMSTASERSSANLSTTDVIEPAGLVLENALAT